LGADDQRTDFTADRIAIKKLNGTVIKERLHPSEHAEGKTVDAPWDVLDRAYWCLKMPRAIPPFSAK